MEELRFSECWHQRKHSHSVTAQNKNILIVLEVILSGRYLYVYREDGGGKFLWKLVITYKISVRLNPEE